MSELTVKIVLFLVVTLAVGMVNGACRATSLNGVLRESLRSFVALAGGIVLLCVGLQLVLLVVQA